MKVLLISSNTLPAAPSGPAYIAGAAWQAGHQVEVFERLFAGDLEGELAAVLQRFQPDVVGISIRLVFGDELDSAAPFGTCHTDLRPRVREIVEVVRRNSGARIVLGGPGFNYYAQDWLEYLELDYGIRGEGEEAFPLFLERLAGGGDLHAVPGSVSRKNGGFHRVPPVFVENLDEAALPAYELFDLEQYAEHKITPAIFTKRGCAFDCTYCPYSKLEGKRYRLKSPERVLAEIQHILQHSPNRRIMICENSFNVPRRHAEAICRAFIQERADFTWGTGDVKPIGVTDDFCKLLEDSGCDYVNLAVESASETMLQRMKRGYTVRQVRQSLESLCRSKLPFGASLMFGAPGESPETIAETLEVMSDYAIPLGVWVTIGVYLWTDYQDIVGELRKTGELNDEQSLFSGVVYISPHISRPYLEELTASLRARPGYQVQVNQSSSM
jgi:radical SAM superfamily enzyme YgiQ (UPF0313 family)